MNDAFSSLFFWKVEARLMTVKYHYTRNVDLTGEEDEVILDKDTMWDAKEVFACTA